MHIFTYTLPTKKHRLRLLISILTTLAAAGWRLLFFASVYLSLRASSIRTTALTNSHSNIGQLKLSLLFLLTIINLDDEGLLLLLFYEEEANGKLADCW